MRSYSSILHYLWAFASYSICVQVASIVFVVDLLSWLPFKRCRIRPCLINWDLHCRCCDPIIYSDARIGHGTSPFVSERLKWCRWGATLVSRALAVSIDSHHSVLASLLFLSFLSLSHGVWLAPLSCSNSLCVTWICYAKSIDSFCCRSSLTRIAWCLEYLKLVTMVDLQAFNCLVACWVFFNARRWPVLL